MSLYNMINGFSPACVLIMPMLGRKQEEYPRFRDCFVEDGMIAIYTRVESLNKEVSIYSDAIDTAISALEKQESKKPLKMKDCKLRSPYSCPECYTEIPPGCEYCWRCGKKIDWTET